MQKLINYFSEISRRKKINLQVFFDILLLLISFLAAMLFVNNTLDFLWQPRVWASFSASALIGILALWKLKFYQTLIRFMTGKIIVSASKGAVVAAIALYAANLFFEANIAFSVLILLIIFVILSTCGLRFAVRNYLRAPNHLNKRPVIIYGAGDTGRQLLNSLFHGNEYLPVAIVDDQPSMHNMSVGGFRVYSPEEMPLLIQNTGAEYILLAMPRIGQNRRKAIVSELTNLNIKVKTVPNVSDLISGRAHVSELMSVSAEDLLGRDPVEVDAKLQRKYTSGHVVLVSGAGGSIGSEICRQVLALNPSVLVLYELSEFALYTIEAELSETAKVLPNKPKIFPILGSVQNSQLLENVIQTFKVHTIYHAAAYKHVPLVEENVVEGIQNNVFGTLTIARAAQKLGVKKFIMISTDKAVRPTNVMGATKRIAELICQAYAQEVTSTLFCMVRFGNVLGSSGSVIPRFETQIKAGGPVTVTHEDITRYFMTVPEAAQLVIQAGNLGKGGEVFVLDMGKSVKIMDLAFNMVKLHGLKPYKVDHPEQILPDEGDIPICVTGLRKGEKLYEELLIGNNPLPSAHPRIMRASEISIKYDVLMAFLERLLKACENYDLPAIFAILDELPLDFSPRSTIHGDLLLSEKRNIVSSYICVNKDGIRE